MTDLAALTATDAVRLYRKRELSPVEVTQDALRRIEAHEGMVNAFVMVLAEQALAQARASEERWRRGEPKGLVDGVPVTVKDNLLLAGLPIRRGARIGSTAPVTEDAPAAARLIEQGAVVLGKTTMPEQGWIGVCHSPLTGTTRNAWNLARTPGGSSGGAAVAAQLNLGPLHLGTDGAGSIRIPAAFSGVYGIKPSFGRVPGYPASPFSVLSHVGPLTRTVADAALMLTVISGPDPRDIMAWNTPPPDYRIGLDDGVRNLRIGVSPRLGYVAVNDPDVEAATFRAADALRDAGATVEEAEPGFADPTEMLMTLWGSVSAAYLDAMSEADRAEMDPGFRRLAEAGRRYTIADYLKAFAGRSDVLRQMLAFHARYDLLLTPTMPIGAFAVDRVVPENWPHGEDWVTWSPYTYPFNLTQQPAASVPAGFTREGMPVGVQLVGPPRRDDLVLRASRALENALRPKFLDEPHP